MYRAAVRSAPRALRTIRPTTQLGPSSRRYLTTAPADKKTTWRGFVARWGLALGAVYWYNTSPIFADEPLPQTHPAPSHFTESDLPTVDAIIEQKRRETRAVPPRAPSAPAATEKAPEPSTAQDLPEASLTPEEAEAGIQPGSPEALEEEAGQQGAFNPETGEINWDCPCLGGMAHGPCGEEFKAAFSCFVYSKEEPKGMECIDKFQHMQDCFRQYPDIYGAELQDDEEEGESAPASAPAPAAEGDDDVTGPKKAHEPAPEKTDSEKPGFSSEWKPELEEKVVGSEVIPKKAVDATAANEKTQ